MIEGPSGYARLHPCLLRLQKSNIPDINSIKRNNSKTRSRSDKLASVIKNMGGGKEHFYLGLSYSQRSSYGIGKRSGKGRISKTTKQVSSMSNHNESKESLQNLVYMLALQIDNGLIYDKCKLGVDIHYV